MFFSKIGEKKMADQTAALKAASQAKQKCSQDAAEAIGAEHPDIQKRAEEALKKQEAELELQAQKKAEKRKQQQEEAARKKAEKERRKSEAAEKRRISQEGAPRKRGRPRKSAPAEIAVSAPSPKKTKATKEKKTDVAEPAKTTAPKAAAPKPVEKPTPTKPSPTKTKAPETPNRSSSRKKGPDLYINERIAKFFGRALYFGTVTSWERDSEDQSIYWQVTYDDGDSEEYDTNDMEAATDLYARHNKKDTNKKK